MNRERALFRAADDAEFQRRETLFCSFHFCQAKVKQFGNHGFKIYLGMTNPISPKSRFIVRTFQFCRSLTYLPLHLSLKLIQHNLDELRTPEMNQCLGDVDNTYLQKILEDIKKDLTQNGSSITWFDVLNRAGVWVDTTSLVIENFE